MYCGIEIELAESKDISKILEFTGIDFGSRVFWVEDDFLLVENRITPIPQEVSADYFRTLSKKSFFAERFVLRLYPKTAQRMEIDTYSDFLKSNCEMIILLYDGCYVEMYCKDQEWLQKMYDNAVSIPGVIVNKKTPESDSRTKMYV